MKNSLDEIYRYEKRFENVKQTLKGSAAPIQNHRSSDFKTRARGSSSVLKSTSKASFQVTKSAEFNCTLQALLLAFSILVLSYNGVLNGRSEYSLLENGETVSGFLPPNRAVVNLSFGYSAPYSVVSSIAAIMLLYSLATRIAKWSLPSMVLCMADLVCDVGDAVVVIWLFFGNLSLTTAILYSIGTVVIIHLRCIMYYLIGIEEEHVLSDLQVKKIDSRFAHKCFSSSTRSHEHLMMNFSSVNNRYENIVDQIVD